MKVKLILFFIFLPIFAWALFGVLGNRISSHLTARFGSQIVAKGDGKFADAQIFVKMRIKEAVKLLTIASLLILAHSGLVTLANRRLQAPARWIAQGWSVFVCLNVLAAFAAHTVLFWSLLYTGKNNINNYTQYNIKQELMKETAAPSQAILMGHSQTRTQIDSKVLNERLGRSIWTTELHFPGSTFYDMVLCLERVPKVHVNYVVTYISEVNFYSGGGNDRFIYFFGLRDLVPYWKLGESKPDFDRYLVCGLLGDIFSLYRVWDSLVDRAKVWQIGDVNQQRYDATLETDLITRAQSVAKTYSLDLKSDFQKREFVTFAKVCRERRCRLVVCCGQLNPILKRVLNPALRDDMMTFLHEQAAADANIVLLEESQMPQQAEGDYEDLTHVNTATRVRFSSYIADLLEKLSHDSNLAMRGQNLPPQNRLVPANH